MKSQNRLKTILIMLLLLLLVSACSNKQKPLIENKNITAQSDERVDIVASNAVAYSWKQISGIEVVLINANTDTLSFITPIVQTQETLVFEVEALMTSALEEKSIKKERATVTVHPLEVLSDNNTTTPTDENTTLPTNPLKSIALTIDKTSLKLDENTTLNAVATYSDNTTKDVTDEVEWITSSDASLKINGKNLKTLKEVNTLLQAKLDSIVSNSVAIEIYKEINGHKLPPQPNKTLNDSTLLGIDSNDNGVRDDVEIWIYETYQDKHPIHIDIAMQAGRAYKQVLETPERALEIHDEVRKARHCEYYYKYSAKYFNEYILIKSDFDRSYLRDNIYFNTKERMKTYIQYDTLLSGGSYTLPSFEEEKAACDFNTSKYE